MRQSRIMKSGADRERDVVICARTYLCVVLTKAMRVDVVGTVGGAVCGLKNGFNLGCSRHSALAI
jgi:hypothetical protein